MVSSIRGREDGRTAVPIKMSSGERKNVGGALDVVMGGRHILGSHGEVCRVGPNTINLVRHTPWRTSDDNPNMDGERPQVVKLEAISGRKCEETVREEPSVTRPTLMNTVISVYDLEPKGRRALSQQVERVLDTYVYGPLPTHHRDRDVPG